MGDRVAYCYVFIDESGNYDFSPNGTKDWILTSLITEDIHPGLFEISDLKHQLIDLGTDIEYFHTTEDRQAVRNGVFEILRWLLNLRVDSLIVDKRKVAPRIKPLDRFYREMADQLLKCPLNSRGIDIKRYERVFFRPHWELPGINDRFWWRRSNGIYHDI